MGEDFAMEGFVGFKVAILSALFSAMVAAETQYPSFEEYMYFVNNGHHPFRETAWFECRPDQAERLLAAGASIEQQSFQSYGLLGQLTDLMVVLRLWRF